MGRFAPRVGRWLVAFVLSACSDAGGKGAEDSVQVPTGMLTSSAPDLSAPSAQPGASAKPSTQPDASGEPSTSPQSSASTVVSGAPAASLMTSVGEPNSAPSSARTSQTHPIPPGSGPLGNETTCDGVDDDENGVIDDVDEAADRVCDCLRIATLGLHGEWGEGEVLKDWFEQRAQTQATEISSDQLTLEALAPFHVLLIRDVSANHSPELSFNSAQAEALKQWVRSGGGLMTVIGYSDAAEIGNVNTLLAPISLNYGSDPIVPGEGAATAVKEWFEHPVTQGIAQVGADNGYPVEGQGFTIAAQDGYDLGKAVTIGDGHVLVWGDEWITYAAEWSASTTFQVERFWQNALVWLARADQCQVPVQ
jgi:hypothetical protein